MDVKIAGCSFWDDVLICETITQGHICCVFRCFFFPFLLIVQWNPVNTATKGAGQIVRINGVAVLSGFSEKKKSRKDEGKRFLIVL